MGDESPPPLDADRDELDNYWLEDTTITVPRIVKRDLDEHRDGKKWGPYLEELRRQYADPLTLRDIDEIAEQLKDDLSMVNEPGVEMDVAELYERIDELEDAVKEATNAAQNAERTAEKVKRNME